MNFMLLLWPSLDGEKQFRPKSRVFPAVQYQFNFNHLKNYSIKAYFLTQVIAHPGIALLLCGLFCRGADKELAHVCAQTYTLK